MAEGLALDIWIEQLERRHLPTAEHWLGRTAGKLTPNDLPSDVSELESWFEACTAEPGRLDCLALVYETPVGVAGLRQTVDQDTAEMYLMLGEVGYNLLRTAACVTLRMLDRAFSEAGIRRVAVRVGSQHGWFVDTLEQMGFSKMGTEAGIVSLRVEKSAYLNRRYLF